MTSVVIDCFVVVLSNDERLSVQMMTLYDDVVFYYGCFSESEFFIDKYVKMYYKKILKQIFEIGIFFARW